MVFTNSKKLELIRSESNENTFRTQVLIPLYRNMGKFEKVVDNHGPNEKGTDIVLIEKSTFGNKYRYTSVILKTKVINNATTGTDTASNIIQQITSAIKSGYNCSIAGQKVHFNTILVITNQTISNTAQEMLNQHAQDLRSIEVEFQEGEDLVGLIDDYLPNFYYYKSGSVARVAESLQKKWEQFNDFQHSSMAHSIEQKYLLDIFVTPRLRFLDTKKKEGRRGIRPVIKTIKDILETQNRILISGEPGSGKSFILRQILLDCLSSNTRENRKPQLPLLLKAHDLAKSSESVFIDRINDVASRYYDISEFDFDTLSQMSIITLMIDGLDEVVSELDREKLKVDIVDFGKQNSDLKIIVTSRITQEGTNQILHYNEWEILPFSRGQINELINKWFSNEDSKNRLIEHLTNHELLSRLPQTPLVITLLAILFDSDDYREVPANLSELYKMFLDLLLGRWNIDRRVETMYNASIKEYLAIRIAQYMHDKNLIAISEDEFYQVIMIASDDRGINDLNPTILLTELTDQTGLLRRNDKHELEFRHLSFQEFLVALGLSKSDAKDKVNFIIDNFEDSWWTKVLYFYCGLIQDTPDVFRKLSMRLELIETHKRIYSILELGYLVQTAYLTEINVRIRTIQTALTQFYLAVSSINNLKINNTSIAEGLIYPALIWGLATQYSSRILQPHYLNLFSKFKENRNLTEEDSFIMLCLAILVAQNNDFKPLSDVRVIAQNYPKQLFTIEFFASILLSELSSEEKRKLDARELKSTLGKIKSWFKQRPTLKKGLLEPSNDDNE